MRWGYIYCIPKSALFEIEELTAVRDIDAFSPPARGLLSSEPKVRPLRVGCRQAVFDLC